MVGGLPDIAPNTTTVDKVVAADVHDIRFRRRRRSAGTILGVTTDGRAVKSVSGDMQGWISVQLKFDIDNSQMCEQYERPKS